LLLSSSSSLLFAKNSQTVLCVVCGECDTDDDSDSDDVVILG